MRLWVLLVLAGVLGLVVGYATPSDVSSGIGWAAVIVLLAFTILVVVTKELRRQ